MAELCSHQLNATNWFLGSKPEAVHATGGVYRFKDGREVFDHVYATFEYPNGQTAVFSSVESNAFDDYYEMFMGTKGTLILRREIEALFFEEGGGEGATSITVAPQTGGPVALIVRNPDRQHEPADGAGLDGDAAVRAAAVDAAADSAVLFGDSRRNAAGVRARQGLRFGRRVASAPMNP